MLSAIAMLQVLRRALGHGSAVDTLRNGID